MVVFMISMIVMQNHQTRQCCLTPSHKFIVQEQVLVYDSGLLVTVMQKSFLASLTMHIFLTVQLTVDRFVLLLVTVLGVHMVSFLLDLTRQKQQLMVG